MYQWLDNALDIGIKEAEFWDMTIAELERVFNSYSRREKQRAQEKASFDYLLADLIGKSISRVYSSSAKMPDISAVYPTLFDSKEIAEQRAAKKAELSALRFKQFAESYNEHLKERKMNE